MRHRHDLGLELQPRPQRGGQRGGKPVVSPLDAIHPSQPHIVGGELVDEGDERQLLGIGKKEPAQAQGGRTKLLVGTGLVEPGCHRAARNARRDRRVPPLLGQPVAANQRLEAAGEQLPAAGDIPLHDARTIAAVLAHVAEPAAQDRRQLQTELAGELANLALATVDHVAAGLGVLPLLEAVAHREHATADAVAGVDDGDLCAHGDQIACRGEAGQTGAGHHDRHSVQRTPDIVSHTSYEPSLGGGKCFSYHLIERSMLSTTCFDSRRP